MLGADYLRKVGGYDSSPEGRSMRSRACGATSTRNGDSWRVSSRPKGLGGIHPLSVRSGFLQTSRIGLVMAWKRHCVPMETLRRGRLGLLHRNSLLGLVRWCLACRFCVADQSLRSSCLPMTILAQLRDCHSCYDERSMVKKKKWLHCSALILKLGLPPKKSRVPRLQL